MDFESPAECVEIIKKPKESCHQMLTEGCKHQHLFDSLLRKIWETQQLTPLWLGGTKHG